MCLAFVLHSQSFINFASDVFLIVHQIVFHRSVIVPISPWQKPVAKARGKSPWQKPVAKARGKEV